MFLSTFALSPEMLLSLSKDISVRLINLASIFFYRRFLSFCAVVLPEAVIKIAEDALGISSSDAVKLLEQPYGVK